MRKKIVILVIEILLIIGGIFLAVYFFQNNASWKNFLAEVKEQISETIQNSEEKDNKSYNRALYYANERACEDISDDNKKSECQDNARITKFLQNPENADCTVISHEERYINCKNLIFEKTALNAKNKNLCENISETSTKQRCRENIDANLLIEITKNQNANTENCSKLENSFRIECEKLIEYYKTEAQYAEAVKNTDLSACAELNEDNLKKKCQDEIIFKKSTTENLNALCQYISDIDQKNLCLQTTQNNQDNNIFQIATSTDNINLCENISNSAVKYRCHDIITLSLVKKTKNPELCKALKNTENLQICEQIPKL